MRGEGFWFFVLDVLRLSALAPASVVVRRRLGLMPLWIRYRRLWYAPGWRLETRDAWIYVLVPFHWPARLGWELWSRRWEGHGLLIKLGFLKRDAALPEWEGGYYRNFRWQWRFWRGPYREAALALGLVPPRWIDSWRNTWAIWGQPDWRSLWRCA